MNKTRKLAQDQRAYRAANSPVRLLFSCGGGVELYRRRDTSRWIFSGMHPLGQDQTTEHISDDKKLAFCGELGLIADVNRHLHVRGGAIRWSTLAKRSTQQFDSPLSLAVTVGVGYRF